MPSRDRLLALLVAVCWGVNFPATHLALRQFPPLLLVCVRFALIAIPTVLLVPRPVAPARWLLGYGIGFGILQFAFLYLGMQAGMPTGLASLVLQSSAPFTVVLAAVLLGERLTGRQVAGVAVAFLGLTAIALHRSQLASLLPLVLTLCGGLGWALGNLSNRKAQPDSPMRLMLWMSVIPPLPMLALSLLVEGPQRDWRSLRTIGSVHALPALAGLLYVVVVATVVGSGIWTTLMSRHPSSTVAPFSMMVPVVGMATSWLFLGERADLLEIGLGLVVVSGVLLATAGLRVPWRWHEPPRAGRRGYGREHDRNHPVNGDCPGLHAEPVADAVQY
jgi:O-acetylserine/cysteine efflux transporter